ncbi:BZ3500_MvSof-1268-A1-R1_Chr6-1g08358 [Microbotryum saponariae]|uniref:BZ3500_MvSof-1268-A1-R1_Chr6-1g08358 protein n=1 Tax=Microbotryum saponariae TaxID=289078 RepID=A0A2X0LRB9_9BASI|nr:BZ3500_MvSof-1268-A1-R1_Chr6-1g08358 [Microbotryum saponariae]SDA07642.1 BZ3501_MvSof-1269-A2-R1_Chr6-1g08079 [Microbotryum saponariae]SDA08519.1 BZ3501_MvSof-1269-A2-R1_C32g00107 [Microbotryum saponariae]
MDDDTLEKLYLLDSVQSLLSPSLPSPPPSPRQSTVLEAPASSIVLSSAAGDSVSSSATARATWTGGARAPAPPPPLGLGFEPSHYSDLLHTHSTIPSKRARSSPSAPPSHSALAPPPTADPRRPSRTSLEGTNGLTPDIRASPFSTPRTRPPVTHDEPKVGSEDWTKNFSKDRLRKMAARFRATGRELKHMGDKLAQESTANHAVALAYQTDAILLYVFAFWCDDQAAKTCIAQNWQTIFGLVAYVKRAAQKAKLGLLEGICTRMESIAVYTLAMYEQKQLNHRGAQLLASGAAASTLTSSSTKLPVASSSVIVPPRSNLPAPPPSLPPRPGPPPASGASQDSQSPASAASPPGMVASGSAPATAGSSIEVLKLFVKAGSELFRYQRLWDEAAAHFSPDALARSLPSTLELCLQSSIWIDPGTFVWPQPRVTEEGEEGGLHTWAFAWPVELGKPMMVVHTVALMRCMLQEWARENARGFTLTSVDV